MFLSDMFGCTLSSSLQPIQGLKYPVGALSSTKLLGQFCRDVQSSAGDLHQGSKAEAPPFPCHGHGSCCEEEGRLGSQMDWQVWQPTVMCTALYAQADRSNSARLSVKVDKAMLLSFVVSYGTYLATGIHLDHT